MGQQSFLGIYVNLFSRQVHFTLEGLLPLRLFHLNNLLTFRPKVKRTLVENTLVQGSSTYSRFSLPLLICSTNSSLIFLLHSLPSPFLSCPKRNSISTTWNLHFASRSSSTSHINKRHLPHLLPCFSTPLTPC